MSETHDQWTVETLRQYILSLLREMDERHEQRFNSQKELVASALSSADKAVMKAETAAEKRFDSVNEFRSLVNDQQRTLMPRLEAEIVAKALNDKIDLLTRLLAEARGQQKGVSMSVVIVGSAMTLIISIVVAALRFIK